MTEPVEVTVSPCLPLTLHPFNKEEQFMSILRYKPLYGLLLGVSLLLSQLWLTTVRLSATSEAMLAIPKDLLATVGRSLQVPVTLKSNGASIGAVAFSVDFDEACLNLVSTDSNQDGVPDAISFNVPSGFSASVSFDVNDRDGELDFVLADYSPPIATLPAESTLARIALNVVCTVATGGTRTAAINFSTSPAPSFSDADGRDLSGTVSNGLVTIQPAATTTATALPTITSTLTPVTTPTPSLTVTTIPTATTSATPSLSTVVATVTQIVTQTVTASPTLQATATAFPAISPTNTATGTPSPTVTGTAQPTATATPILAERVYLPFLVQ